VGSACNKIKEEEEGIFFKMKKKVKKEKDFKKKWVGGGEWEHGPPLYHSFFSSFPNLLSSTRLISCICLE